MCSRTKRANPGQGQCPQPDRLRNAGDEAGGQRSVLQKSRQAAPNAEANGHGKEAHRPKLRNGHRQGDRRLAKKIQRKLNGRESDYCAQ